MAVKPVTTPLRDLHNTPAIRSAQPRRKWLSHKVMWAYIFIAPSVLFLLLFALIPILFSGWVSLHSWDMITPIPKMKWIGLDNFTYLFNTDKVFRIAIRNTFIYAFFGVGINTILGLAGALLLNSKIRFPIFWRSIYFLPIVTAPMALGMMWSALLNKNFGMVNSLLGLIHIPPQTFMYSPDTALATLIGIVVYQNVGYYIIIYLAGLQGIPQEYYDAAAVDGANQVQSFRYITLPQLRPVLLFLLITNTIGALQVFDIVFAMTDGTELSGGGPANATMVFVLYMYNTAFKFFKMGRASAMAMILFAIIFLITLFQFRLLRDRK